MYWKVVEVRNRVLSAVPPCHVTLSELWSAKSDLSLYSQWLLHGKTCRLLGSSEAVGLPMKSHKMGWAQTLTFGCESFWHGGHSVGAQLSGDAHWIYGNSCLGKNKKQTQNKTKKPPPTLKACSCFSKIKFCQWRRPEWWFLWAQACRDAVAGGSEVWKMKMWGASRKARQTST